MQIDTADRLPTHSPDEQTRLHRPCLTKRLADSRPTNELMRREEE